MKIGVVLFCSQCDIIFIRPMRNYPPRPRQRAEADEQNTNLRKIKIYKFIIKII